MTNTRSFEIIRQMLACYLHQDFDMEFETLVDAIVAAIKHTDSAKLVEALIELEAQPDAVVEEVLSDHSVHLWHMASPRDFLVTLRTLASLT